MSTSGVYLLHFTTPYKHAKHYLGWSPDVDNRITLHRKGKGARLTQVVVDVGIKLLVAKVWPGMDRTFERQLKRQKNAPQLCPICAQLAREAENPEVQFGHFIDPGKNPTLSSYATALLSLSCPV